MGKGYHGFHERVDCIEPAANTFVTSIPGFEAEKVVPKINRSSLLLAKYRRESPTRTTESRGKLIARPKHR